MSEPMAIELLAEELAKFRGYLTEIRVPFKLEKGGITDFDVIGYSPQTGKSLVIECKAWGSPNQYSSFNDIGFFDKEIRRLEKLWGNFICSLTNKWKLKKLDEINNSLKNLHACLEEIVEKI